MKCSICEKEKCVMLLTTNHEYVCNDCNKEKEKKEGKKYRKEVYREGLPLK